MKNLIQFLSMHSHPEQYGNSHPPIQMGNLHALPLFHYNTDAKYTRCIDCRQLLQIKCMYLSASICAFLLFMLACVLITTSSFALFTIILQAAGIIVFLILFRSLITYLFTGNTLKEYEYHACILFYKTNAFLWLCSIVCALITILSMLVSYQEHDIYALLSFLCCSCLSLFMYYAEMRISYTKDA